MNSINKMLLHLKLYYDTEVKPISHPANDGFERVQDLLKLLEEKGIKWDLVNVHTLTNEQLMSVYFDSTLAPSMSQKYRVRQVFGSRRNSGYLFGRGVPALVVYRSKSRVPEDVYPHDYRGRIVTIKEYLERLFITAQ